jgi:hypothetical protein
MSIHDYFDTLLATTDFDTWDDEVQALIDLIEDEDADLTLWAQERGVDLTLGHEVHGCFFTYFQEWCWSYLED